MKYKVGDKVRVHTKEWFRTNCSKDCLDGFDHEDGSNTFVSSMEKFCGQEITINQVFLGNYNILEDDGEWNWEDWMFEDMNNIDTIYNSNIVEDFAKLIGVELDEEFYDKDYDFCYKITSTDGLMVYNTSTESWQGCTAYCINVFFKMIKEGKFMKKWMPKDSDTVYFPAFLFDNLYDCTTYDSENEHDKEMLKSGLYFRTQKEAIECAKKIIKQMKEG